MCRWFAYLSTTEPCLLEDVLILPDHAIAKQVHDRFLPYLFHYEPDADHKSTKKEMSLRNSPYNLDGLGLVWYTNARSDFRACQGPRPVSYKILRQPQTDPVFQSLCAGTAAHAVFAHIRAASGATAITTYNNHPFTFGRHAFMHNGVVAHFPEIKRAMALALSDGAHDLVKGTTDSELLAALFFTYLEEGRGPHAWDAAHPLDELKRCLERAISTVLGLQRDAMARAGKAPDASSLNIAVTDGEQLLAIRFRNHAAEHPPSLYLSTRAGVALNTKFPGHPDVAGADNGAGNFRAEEEHGDHVIVASEPTTYKEEHWELIPKNQCVMVGRDMVIRRGPVEVQF
ncbi:N-terminal nucleophile aminohydrolase [Trametes versicolor FP-101664 SS1]|uniref:N-terminal nucleophile aminohydrolase n=1 Tax=Trametes versicolor (strain FP-101664) TaxID=717944 RepID=UPI00046224A9|nr:N-terminal nucleophile aminohydrolase [Trametes versicolor FP-101664 SS1]EIW59609.1 N-terminal nucleophile aminohydrolase [Trametes versicolor FP-101664 SS1]